MTSNRRNSTQIDEDTILQEIDAQENIEVDSCEESFDLSVSEREIAEISSIAANLGLQTRKSVDKIKRQRETSNGETSSSGNDRPPIKKPKTMMAPPPEDDAAGTEIKYVVRLVPDLEGIHLFSEKHGPKLKNSVFKQLKLVKDPKIKFEYCDFYRGRFKFVCPNVETKEYAMNIVPKLTELWADPHIKAIDCGIVPKMIRASVTFNNPAPETLEFFEDVDLKNETIDTNEWRVYNKKKVQGNKTVIFIGIDEQSVEALKAIGFRPYFANGRTKITVDGN